MLRLLNPVNLTPQIQVACLPQNQNNLWPPAQVANVVASPGYAVGWGAQYSTGPLSNFLRNIKLVIFPGTNCGAYPSTMTDFVNNQM